MPLNHTFYLGILYLLPGISYLLHFGFTVYLSIYLFDFIYRFTVDD